MSLALLTKIKEAIDKHHQKALPFDDFMALALYTPELGYYAKGKTVFGESGDFVTAPMISPIFSHCMGNQVAEAASALGKTYDLVEYGPGNGILAAGVIKRLQTLEALPRRLYLIEHNPSQQQQQRKTLEEACPDYLPKVQWCQKPPALDKAVVLANELLDAFPVKRFEIGEEELIEWGVIVKEEALAWEKLPASSALIEAVEALQEHLSPNTLPPGYSSEINVGLRPWFEEIAACIKQGVVLCLDYGYPRQEYYHPERRTGTIMCHQGHRAHSDPLHAPGDQDITAHVDFTAVKEAAEIAGFSLLGFCSQAGFLIGAGLMDAIEHEPNAMAAVQTLLSPSQMGETIKCVALGFQLARPLPLSGFSASEQTHRLLKQAAR